MLKGERNRVGRLVRGVGIALAGLVVLLLLAAGSAALWLSRADLKPLAERAAGAALERQVTFGRLEIGWGNPLRLDIEDLAVANAPWGNAPQMIRAGRVSALIDLDSLFRGTMRYERLRIADATIALERDEHGTGNWEFGDNWELGDGASGLALLPQNRTEFPTLVDFIGDRGLITYRTRSGTLLSIKLDHAAISSPSDDTPARLVADGAYNDVPTRLDAETDSFATLRDDSVPFGARFTLRARDTDLAFNGRLWEPLDFEGARGELSIEARTPNEILGMLGAEVKADVPLSIAGILRRDGDLWSLAAAKGELKQSGFAGGLALNEGAAGEPDDLALDLHFSTLDLDDLMATSGGAHGPPGLATLPLSPPPLAGLDMTAALSALRAIVGGRVLHAAAFEARMAGGQVRVNDLSFAVGGGTLKMAASLADGKLHAQARLSKARIGGLAHLLGAPGEQTPGEQIRGRMDGAAILSMTGPTIGAALARSEGAAVVALRNGVIARDLIERLSGDLRGLFRTGEGTMPVSCMLGVVTMKNGLGLLSPLRLESDDAIATGTGKIDLRNNRLDMTIKTERASTSFFALDLPVRISGRFDGLSAEPIIGADRAALRQSAAAHGLPADLLKMANRSGCWE